MQFLTVLKPVRLGMVAEGPTPAEADVVGRHFEYLQRLLAQGVLILAGRTVNPDENCFGIAIMNAASEGEARALANDDPVVREGVMTAQVFPYRVALISEANAR